MHSVCMAKGVPIRVKREIRKILKDRKKFDGETYSEVIKRELREVKKIGK